MFLKLQKKHGFSKLNLCCVAPYITIRAGITKGWQNCRVNL